jgi:hypothetical protein
MKVGECPSLGMAYCTLPVVAYNYKLTDRGEHHHPTPTHHDEMKNARRKIDRFIFSVKSLSLYKDWSSLLRHHEFFFGKWEKAV